MPAAKDPFLVVAAAVITSVPRGRVTTYGQVAALSGSPRSARQVVRLLHSSSRRLALPWHRVVGKPGRIALARGCGFEEQARRLRSEGVRVSRDGRVDLEEFGWRPRPGTRNKRRPAASYRHTGPQRKRSQRP